MFTKKYLHQN